jgi:vacuolar-type H+-ATPase subunit I/STV1
MAARDVVRQAGIWLIFAGYLALCIVTIVATDESWTLVAWGGFAIVGTLLLLRRSGNAIGRILLGMALYWSLYGAITIPGVAAELPAWIELVLSSLGYAVWMLLPVLIAVFPSGRVTSRLGGVVVAAALTVAVLVVAIALITPGPLVVSGRENPLGVPAVAPLSAVALGDESFLSVPVIGLAALIDLVVRWVRADGATRLQFRWLAYGTAVTVLILGTSLFFDDAPPVLTALMTLGINAIPIAIWVAVTRHGLYEIGRVVSRTVSYAIVTALVIAVYATIVTSVTALAPDIPTIGVALATLAAAALFLPVLRFVQRRIDRRFDREHFDAQHVVDEFGEHLRTGTDPATTGGDLTAAVERTLQPTAIGLWTSGSRT